MSDLPHQGHPLSGEPGETVILSADAIEAQRAWSGATFGPGWRNGTVEHLKKEAQEILDAWEITQTETDATLDDLQGECIDALILALDLCWRSGMSGAETITRYFHKRQINEQRTWPDWRGLPTDVAIEHDRTGEERPHLNVSNASLTLESLAAIYGSDVKTLHNAIVRATAPPEASPTKPQAPPNPYWAPKEDMWMGQKTHEWVIQCFGVGDSGRGHAERWASEGSRDEQRRVWNQPPPAPGTTFYSAKKIPATTQLIPEVQ